MAQWLRAARQDAASRRTARRYAAGISILQVGRLARLVLAETGVLPEASLTPCGDYGRPVGDVVRGLRQALLMLLFSAVVALAVAGLWSAVQGGGFWSKAGIALMVIAGLVSLMGGTALSRAATNDERAFLGLGPNREEPDTGEGLTGLGIFLFVSLPLFIVGGVLVESV